MARSALLRSPRTATVLLAALALTATAAGVASAAGTTAPGSPARRAGDTGGSVLAADTFDRTVSGGFGTAPTGGAWTTPATSTNSFSVSPGAGRLGLLAPGAGANATLSGVASTDTDLTLGLALDKPQTGGGTYLAVVGRQKSGSNYQLKLHFYPGGTVSETLVLLVSGVETAISSTVVPAATYAPGSVLRVRLDVQGTAPTSLSAKIWPSTVTQPGAWQLTATDSTPVLQVAGGVGVTSYLSGAATNAPMTVSVSALSATGAVTTITGGPADGSRRQSTSALFSFVGSRPGSTFQCRLDAAAWSACTSPALYTSLAVGAHTFSVQALDPAGHVATAASRTWTVDAPAGTEPGPGSTGVPAGTVLTPYYGTLTLDTPGAHYDSLDVHGFVWVKAADVTITRSIIRGGVGTPGVDQGLVTNYGYPGFVIRDSELVPEYPSVSLDAIKGWDFTAVRIDAHGTVDGAKIHGDDVVVQDSWIHNMVDYPSDPYQGGGPTHNDGAQILGGNNIVLRGNNIYGASNSAVQVTQDLRAVTRLTITGNWFDGGHQNVALNAKPLPTLADILLTNNRFGRHTTYRNCAVLTWGTVILTARNNVWDDDGTPIVIHPG